MTDQRPDAAATANAAATAWETDVRQRTGAKRIQQQHTHTLHQHAQQRFGRTANHRVLTRLEAHGLLLEDDQDGRRRLGQQHDQQQPRGKNADAQQHTTPVTTATGAAAPPSNTRRAIGRPAHAPTPAALQPKTQTKEQSGGQPKADAAGRKKNKKKVPHNKQTDTAAAAAKDDDDDAPLQAHPAAAVPPISSFTQPLFGGNDAVLILQPPLRHSIETQVWQEERLYGRTLPAQSVWHHPDVLVDAADVLLDDGLYAPPAAAHHAAVWNLRKIEARMLRNDQQRQYYFTELGYLALAPDPTKPGSGGYRPIDARSNAPLLNAGEGGIGGASSAGPAVSYLHQGAGTSDNDAAGGQGGGYNASLTTVVMDPPVLSTRDKWFEFRVHIQALRFDDHALLTREDRWCIAIEKMHAEFHRRRIVNLFQFYTDRIVALKRSARTLLRRLEPLLEKKSGSTRRRTAIMRELVTVLEELCNYRERKDREEFEEQFQFKTIYETWAKVRVWRAEKQRRQQRMEQPGSEDASHGSATGGGGAATTPYCGYPLILKVRKNANDKTKDIAAWRTDERDELFERRKLNQLKSLLARQSMDARHLRRLIRRERVRLQEREQEVGADDDVGGDDIIIEKQAQLATLRHQYAVMTQSKFDVHAVRDGVRSRMKRFRRGPGKPSYFPVLNKKVAVTPSMACGAEEQQRRRAIAQQRIKLELRVNGELVTSTPPAPLRFPRFDVPLNFSVDLKLLSMPQTVTCTVLFVSRLAKTRVAEVIIPVPEFGQAPTLHTVTFGGRRIDHGVADRSLRLRLSSLDPASPEAHAIRSELQQTRFVLGSISASLYWSSLDAHAHQDALVMMEALKVENFFGEQDAMRSSSRDVVLRNAVVPPSGVGTVDGDRSVVRPKRRHWKVQHGRAGLTDAQYQHLKFDPNDPRNAAIIELLRRNDVSMRYGKLFRPVQFDRELELIDARYHVPSIRLKVLQARNANPAFRESVPLRTCDIGEHLYEFVNVDPPSESAAGRSFPGSLDRKRERRVRAASRRAAHAVKGDTRRLTKEEEIERRVMRARLQHKARMLQIRNVTYDVNDVVHEGPWFPDLKPLLTFAWLDTLFKPRRKLRVDRDDRKPMTAPDTCNLVVQIVRGQNLPVCVGPVGFAEEADNLRAFVNVSFQSREEATESVSGTNPRWNEVIVLPFFPPDGSWTPSYLKQIDQDVYFTVFDDHGDRNGGGGSGGAMDGDGGGRFEDAGRRYLGSFRIPFTTIFLNGSVEGMFRLDVPLLHLGYRRPEPLLPSIVWVHATLDPVLKTPPDTSLPDMSEMEAFFRFCFSWAHSEQQRSEATKSRIFKPIVSDINGMPRLVCKYITEQQPPDGMENPDIFTRFVACIPFEEDVHMSEGVRDVWCSSSEFLTLASGDWEEHAVLLCNYFRWFERATNSTNWSTYVCMGHAIPAGETSFVLRIHTLDGLVSRRIIIDAVEGEVYDLDIDYGSLPLTNIGTVFNDQNVWINVQGEALPHELAFDFTKSGHWKPLVPTSEGDLNEWLELRFHRQLEDIQSTPLYYSVKDSYYTDRAHALERIIERQFDLWRPGQVTKWDYGVCRILRDMLRDFEFYKQKLSDEIDFEPLVNLQHACHRLYGFPLNFCEAGGPKFMIPGDENPVCQAVKNTGLHETEEEGVVFGVAVYMHKYVNKVSSVWVFIATYVTETDVV